MYIEYKSKLYNININIQKLNIAMLHKSFAINKSPLWYERTLLPHKAIFLIVYNFPLRTYNYVI